MKKKGYTAPIIIAAVMLLYYIGLGILLISLPGLFWWARLLLCIVPALLGAVVIYVLVQRIREISSTESDDLHKY